MPGLDIMLKLMEGMQQMQRQILDHGASKRSRSEERDEESMEYVRYNQEMPKLPEWDPETAPIDFSDWLLVLTPVVGDLSATSSEWWAIVLESAKKWYEDHMQMSPLERLDHQALEPPEMKRHKWGRLEKRVSNLLLAALPPSQKEEVIAAKDLRVMSILTKTMLVFQPGGLNEKSAILHALEAPPEATSVTQGLLHLRRWTRWKRRASEVGVSMPDATILVRGLNKMLRKILAANPHLEFRVNLVRSNLMIDTAPTYEKVSHFAQSVLAELDSVAYADRRKKDVGDPKENVKMKKFEEGGGKGKGKSREDDQKEDAQKTPCKFYLTEGGCKKGRQCTWSHDLKDDKRRCYSCGSPAHLSNACTVKNNQKDQGKPKIASAKKEEDTGGLKSSDRGAPASPVPSDTVEVGSSASGEETMKGLLEEANKMLRSMATPSEGDKLQKLQRQLDELRSGGPQMKVFRLSKMGTETHYGLLDSGATHPLRGRWPKERLVAYPDVPVTLAGGQEVKMKLAPTGAIVSQDPRVEPIVPMGALMTQLGCKLCWTLEGLEVEHPSRGRLEVKMQGDCPMVPRSIALDLIHELEEKARRTFRSLGVGEDAEVKFIQMLVESHPVFEGVPKNIKEALVVKPEETLKAFGNRRRRKLWRRRGMVIHLFSGAKDGYPLQRAVKEIGGDHRLLHEVDVVHGEGGGSDFGTAGIAYGTALRAAFDGSLKALIAGPPCRTRSVLRHYKVENIPEMPRPIRAWGQEFGLKELSDSEREALEMDDILMFRSLMVYIVAEELRKMEGLEEEVGFGMEQPTEPDYNEDVVSWWRTPQWKAMERSYKFAQQKFLQSTLGALASKPTTWAGNLQLDLPEEQIWGRKRQVEGLSKEAICKASKALARWPPLMMRLIAMKLQTKIWKEEVTFRKLSWQEHVAAGHAPFRSDCMVCQRAAGKEGHHKRSKLPPKVGVLSVDFAGPLKLAEDLFRGSAKYLLIGAFVWFANEKEEEEPEIILDEEEKQLELEDEEAANQEGAEADDEREDEEEGRQDEVEEEKDDEEKEGEVEEREEVKTKVIKLAVPIPSRAKAVVQKAIAGMYIQLKSDGYQVSQLHSDMATEFRTEELASWCRARDIAQTFTAGNQPQSNGRAESTVAYVKSRLRRALFAANVGVELWPIAARYRNEVFRKEGMGEKVKWPTFYSKVVVRKRFWRTRELEPTQEVVRYLAPSWAYHGHWVLRPDGSQVLTRMVMHNLVEPPALQDWIALEDQLSPLEARWRIRGRLAARGLCLAEESEDEEQKLEEQKKVRRLIEEELTLATEAEQDINSVVAVEGVVKLRQCLERGGPEDEVLQTRIIPQGEVRREIEVWRKPIQAELDALLRAKEALEAIPEKQGEEWLKAGEAELIPSKMVYSIKPDPMQLSGKRKARIVACGNYAEDGYQAQDLYAGGASAMGLRLSIALAAKFQWHGMVLDVKNAFLNAPMKLPKDGEKVKRALMRPPPMLVQHNFCRADELWWVKKAMYGYRVSPRLWSDHRDQELARLPVVVNGRRMRLVQLVSEPSLWKLLPEDGSMEQEMVGLLVVYVDDVLSLGPPQVIAAMKEALQSLWETSTPELVGEQEAVRFLGGELWREEKSGTWRITQQAYIQDLLQRNGALDQLKVRRTPMAKEIEEEEEAEIEEKEVKEAQRFMGELVWVVTRSRPDLMLAVSKLSTAMAKHPRAVKKSVEHLWGYMKDTTTLGLVFKKEDVEEEILKVFTDASFGEKPWGCILIHF